MAGWGCAALRICRDEHREEGYVSSTARHVGRRGDARVSEVGAMLVRSVLSLYHAGGFASSLAVGTEAVL